MKGLRALGRRLWDGWLAVMARFGEVQTLVILGFCYGLLIGPVGVGATLLGNDFLARKGLREPGSAWREADCQPPDLERAKRPF